MKFSTKSRYALRLMAELARYAPGTTVSLKEISERQNLSLKYLEQIVTPLARVGLVKSERGSQGGYRLTKAPADYTAGEILRAIEGSVAPIPCLGSETNECPMSDQCFTLPFWAGLDNVTEEKQTILGDAELEPTFDYGASMRNSGKGGSKYRNYKDAAEEIIQGCIDIATEVGSQKIGRPANGTSSEDINYIESPYSQNSKTDFIDNIISIRNTYQGMTSGDASVSDWIEVVDPVLDTEVRNAISTAIEKIEACPAPFVDNRTAQAWKDAATYCNNDLVNALTKALTALSVEK